MAKKDTAAAIKAANGSDLNPDSYTSAQLEELLLLAQKGEAGKGDFEAKLAGFAPAPAAPAAATEPKKLVKPINVRVNDIMAGYGGEFTDPDSFSTIGKNAVEVETTAFVLEKLRSGELIEER